MNKNTTAKKGLVASIATVTALGAYYFYGTAKGKEQREKATAWILKEAKQYKSMKDVDPKDILKFVKNIGDEWSKMSAPTKKAPAKKTVSKKITALKK